MKTTKTYYAWANPGGKAYDFCVCYFPSAVKSIKAAKAYAKQNGWALDSVPKAV
jgi:hypothetical protein